MWIFIELFFLSIVFGYITVELIRWLYCVECPNTVFGLKHSAISNTWFLRPTRVLITNGISIASAVFAGLTR